MRLFYSKGFFTLLNHFFKMMDRDYYDYGNPIGIRSTAGAVPVMNEKGTNNIFHCESNTTNMAA